MNRTQFLATSGLETATLEIWLEQRWLIPGDSSDGPAYSEIDIARVRFINELRHDIGANDAGIDVILHLVDQLHGLRRALDDVRYQVNAEAAPHSKAKPAAKAGGQAAGLTGSSS